MCICHEGRSKRDWGHLGVECFSRGLFLDYSLKKLCVSKRCNVVIVLMDCDIVDFGDESPFNAPLISRAGGEDIKEEICYLQ